VLATTVAHNDDGRVAANALPERPGWYPDPYTADLVRWFDGSKWTIHAVPSTEAHPDQVAERNADPRTPEERREEEWKDQFPWWDTAVGRGAEPRFHGQGGATGFGINQAMRFNTRLLGRLKDSPLRPVAWLFILLPLIALMALGDLAQRVVLLLVAAIVLLISLGFKLRSRRQAGHWKRVGQQD
jgi:hypothetical protein